MGLESEVLARFQTDGVGTAATNMFYSSKASIPPGDGPFLTLVVYGGTDALDTQNSGDLPLLVRPSAQVSVVASTYDAAMAMAKAAYASVCKIRNAMLGSTLYISARPAQEPFDMGLDTETRPKVGFNIRFIKQPS